MILETEAPVDDATDHGDEEPGPEGEVEIADGAAEIEGEPNQGGACGDGEAKGATTAGEKKGEDRQQAGAGRYPRSVTRCRPGRIRHPGRPGRAGQRFTRDSRIDKRREQKETQGLPTARDRGLRWDNPRVH